MCDGLLQDMRQRDFNIGQVALLKLFLMAVEGISTPVQIKH